MIDENEKKVAEELQYEYSDHEETKLEKLRKLDAKAKRPANIFASIFGVVGALVLGVGMCLALKVIGNLMVLGIVIGVVGIAMISVNYFIYLRVVKSGRKKYAKEIIELSDDILNN